MWFDWVKGIANAKPDEGDLTHDTGICLVEPEVVYVLWSHLQKDVQGDPATWLVVPKGQAPERHDPP